MLVNESWEFKSNGQLIHTMREIKLVIVVNDHDDGIVIITYINPKFQNADLWWSLSDCCKIYSLTFPTVPEIIHFLFERDGKKNGKKNDDDNKG